MLAVKGEAERMAAVLHDVVEDTPVTLDQLRELGFPEEVIAGVATLTKRPGDKANYFAFVERAGQNDIARPVKLADIEDNLDLSRISTPTERDSARTIDYRRARRLLHLMGRERGETTERAPTIMPLRSEITREEVEKECPGTRPIHVCDFTLKGAGQGTEVLGGLQLGRILNVDHHAELPCMELPITSTKLAATYRRGRPAGEPAAWVVINHTDDMWMYWVPLQEMEHRNLELRSPDESTSRADLGVFHELIRSRSRLMLHPGGEFSWSDSRWLVSDMLPPG